MASRRRRAPHHVLVVDDGTLTAMSMVRHLKQVLSVPGVKMSVASIHRSGRDLIAGTASGRGIAEFYGSARRLQSQVTTVDVLVVHRAPVTRDVIEAARHLRVIACARGNPLNVDVKAASERGVAVVCAPGRAAESVADLTMGLILGLARHIVAAAGQVNHLGLGAWDYTRRSALEGSELAGKTLGIIGYGEAGQRLAMRARAFGMRVLVYSRHVSSAEIARLGSRKASLVNLLKQADVVTLHAKPVPGKLPMIGQKELRLMKRSAYLVNTARGALIDEKALLKALTTGRLRGAALDVLSQEPPPRGNRLLRLPNVIITPHIGGKTVEAAARAAEVIGQDIVRFLRGMPLENVVNLACPGADHR